VHTVNSETVLAIPRDLDRAPLASGRAEVWPKAVFVAIDVLFLAAAAEGVYPPIAKAKLAPKLRGVTGGFVRLFNLKAAREMKRLVDQEKYPEVILRVLRGLRGTTNVTKIVGIMVDSMSVWEKCLAALQLVASVALIVATGGASLAARIVQFGAALAILATDVVDPCRAVAEDSSSTS